MEEDAILDLVEPPKENTILTLKMMLLLVPVNIKLDCGYLIGLATVQRFVIHFRVSGEGEEHDL